MRARVRALRTAAGLIGLVALAVVTAGCFRIEIGIRINDDGSGAVSILSAIDTSFADAIGDLAGDGGDLNFAEAFTEVDESELPAGATVEPYEEGDFSGIRVTVPFEASDDVAASIERTFATVGDETTAFTGEEGLFRSLVLERTDSGWRFRAELDISADELTGDAEDNPFGDALAQLLLQDASIVIRLALPGEIDSHNADEVDGDELVWNIDFLADEVLTLSATSTVGSGDDGGGDGTMITVIAVVALIAVAAAAAGYAYTRRRSAD